MYNQTIHQCHKSLLLPSSLSFSTKSHYLEVLLVLLFSSFILFLHRLRPKSPFFTNFPIFGMVPGFILCLNRLHDSITDILSMSINHTYLFKGPILLGPQILVTCYPSNIHYILTVNYKNYPKGNDFAEIFDFLGNGIFCADGESWVTQRKLAQALMVSRGYKGFVLRTTSEITKGRLVPILDRWVESSEVVDLEKVFKRTTFDITCISSFGADLGALSAEFPIVEFSDAVDAAWQATVFRQLVPMRVWKLFRLLNLGEEKKLANSVPVIDNFIMQQISKRRDELPKRSTTSSTEANDLLTSYIARSDEFDDKFLRDTALTLLIAGKDAFGVTLTWLFCMLYKNPRVEEKILAELTSGKDLNSMVYLHATLCEVMRLYPPVAFERKEVMESDELPSGHKIEPKTSVLIPMYAMGRMESIWGKDCLEFKPERWIGETGNVRHVPSYKFPVFNAGPRSCIGKEIGLTQLKMVAAELIPRFKVEVVNVEEVVPENSVFMGTRNGMRVKVKKRVVVC